LLFVTDADSAKFRALTQTVAIDAARIYAQLIDDVIDGLDPREMLLSLLIDRLYWRKRRNVMEYLYPCFYRYHDRRNDVNTSELQLPFIAGLVEFRLELPKRYYDEIMRRSLMPFAFSLMSNGDDDILTGGERLDLSLEWHGCNEPRDPSAVQFFETVGLALKGSACAQDTLFIDGEVKRAIARGKEGRVTLDEGCSMQFADIAALLRWLALPSA
jgi:hypothetical protein